MESVLEARSSKEESNGGGDSLMAGDGISTVGENTETRTVEDSTERENDTDLGVSPKILTQLLYDASRVNEIYRTEKDAAARGAGIEPSENSEAIIDKEAATKKSDTVGDREIAVALERTPVESIAGRNVAEEEEEESDNSSDVPLVARRSNRRRSVPCVTIETRFSQEQKELISRKICEMESQSAAGIEGRLVVWLNELERSRQITRAMQGVVSGTMKVNIRLIREGTKILCRRITSLEGMSSRLDSLTELEYEGRETKRENRDLRNLLNARGIDRVECDRRRIHMSESHTGSLTDDTDVWEDGAGSMSGGSVFTNRSSDREMAYLAVNTISSAVEEARKILDPTSNLASFDRRRIGGGTWSRPRNPVSPYRVPRRGVPRDGASCTECGCGRRDGNRDEIKSQPRRI